MNTYSAVHGERALLYTQSSSVNVPHKLINMFGDSSIQIVVAKNLMASSGCVFIITANAWPLAIWMCENQMDESICKNGSVLLTFDSRRTAHACCCCCCCWRDRFASPKRIHTHEIGMCFVTCGLRCGAFDITMEKTCGDMDPLTPFGRRLLATRCEFQKMTKKKIDWRRNRMTLIIIYGTNTEARRIFANKNIKQNSKILWRTRDLNGCGQHYLAAEIWFHLIWPELPVDVVGLRNKRKPRFNYNKFNFYIAVFLFVKRLNFRFGAGRPIRTFLVLNK